MPFLLCKVISCEQAEFRPSSGLLTFSSHKEYHILSNLLEDEYEYCF